MTCYKSILISLLIVVTLITKAQPMLSISNATVQITPSYTINNGTSFSVTGSVKNVSTYSITNTIHVHLAIDTSSTSTPKYSLRSTHTYSVTNFLPNQMLAFNVGDVGSDANGYKTNGNGTTVVIWGVVGFPTNDSTTYDSVKTTLFVLPLPQSIHNLEQAKNVLNAIPNPLTQTIIFTNNQNWIIELIDLNGRVTNIENSTLNIQHFPNGLYVLKLRDEMGYEISKKIMIDGFY